MIVTSDTEPQPIEIDLEKDGTARVLVRWNVAPIEKTDEAGAKSIAYEYEEKAVWITAADPAKALETRTAGLVDACAKGVVGTVQIAADEAGLPRKMEPAATDPALEADEAVRARTESGYRTLPPPRGAVRRPPTVSSSSTKPGQKEPIDIEPINTAPAEG